MPCITVGRWHSCSECLAILLVTLTSYFITPRSAACLRGSCSARRFRPQLPPDGGAFMVNEEHLRAAPAWKADWVVTPEVAKSLVEMSFPALAPVSVRELGRGWDNTVLLVNDSFVFRFPRRRIAASLIETEVRLLPWIARQ